MSVFLWHYKRAFTAEFCWTGTTFYEEGPCALLCVKDGNEKQVHVVALLHMKVKGLLLLHMALD